ncbi:MAG: glycosyltransferase family 4 protein [Alphaproteobacteria bacterium]|nr:glycosyltransferase family 4 protein [Alphaproteobacteria bacterium]
MSDRPLRIAVWHNLPSGGGKRALYDHVRGLVDRGHHVEAWAPPSADRTYLPLNDMIEEHILPYGDDSYRLTDKLQLTLHIDRRLAAMEEHARRCAAEIARGGFDLLFANSCMYFRSAPIGRFVDLPSVLYLQEPYRWLYEAMPEPVWAAPEPGGGLKAAFLDWRNVRNARVQMRAEIASAKAYGRILCNSYFSRESILRAYGLDAEVCYLGIDTNRFSPGSGPRGDFLLGLGSFTREKNPRLCIEALGAVQGPKPRLLWIANFAHDDFLAEMRALAERRGVVLEVQVNAPDETLRTALQTAMAMVFAPRLEPFGLVPLEAGACGTPVIAVAEGGLRETVVDGVNGLVADPTSAGLAAAIARLRDDPSLRARLGEGGRRLVDERWSLAAAAERLEAKLRAQVDAG